MQGVYPASFLNFSQHRRLENLDLSGYSYNQSEAFCRLLEEVIGYGLSLTVWRHSRHDIITESARKTNERMLKPLSVFNEYFDLSVCDDSMVLVAGYQLVFHFFSYHIGAAVLLVKRENYLAGAS